MNDLQTIAAVDGQSDWEIFEARLEVIPELGDAKQSFH